MSGHIGNTLEVGHTSRLTLMKQGDETSEDHEAHNLHIHDVSRALQSIFQSIYPYSLFADPETFDDSREFSDVRIQSSTEVKNYEHIDEREMTRQKSEISHILGIVFAMVATCR